MNAVWSTLRADARGRWRAWVGMALLVGLLGGIVTATAAGARRTDSAYSRLVAANHGAEYLVGDFTLYAATAHPAGRGLAVAALAAAALLGAGGALTLLLPPARAADGDGAPAGD